MKTLLELREVFCARCRAELINLDDGIRAVYNQGQHDMAMKDPKERAAFERFMRQARQPQMTFMEVASICSASTVTFGRSKFRPLTPKQNGL
jgi:hypothetical protein